MMNNNKRMNNNSVDIEKAMDDLSNKRNSLNSMQISGENNLNDLRDNIMGDLASMMSEYGVDVNNIDSINEFLGKLDKINPDLRDIFENALNVLTNYDQGVSKNI